MDIYWMETEQPKSKAAHDLLERILRKDYGIEAPKLSYGPQGKPTCRTDLESAFPIPWSRGGCYWKRAHGAGSGAHPAIP